MVDGSSGLVIVHQSHRAHCAELGLVLDSAGIRYHIHVGPDDCALLVPFADAARARGEIDAYLHENEGWGRDQNPVDWGDGGWWGVGGYAVVLCVMAILQRQSAFGVDWAAAGKTSVVLIRDGEWWRTFTALTLHSGFPHLAANLMAGGLFGRFAGQMLGSGVGWLAILLSGAAGNLLNALIRQPGHTSIGASTAVFAALGLVAAFVWRRRMAIRSGRFATCVPIAGGLALLGLLGTGGGRTDVGAHLTGFVAGLLLGGVMGTFWHRLRIGTREQLGAGIATIALLIVAWNFAIAG
ncbi:MAG: rhomboid family intramembrane serine protease [Planctomycetota bacterium]|jgi:MYXO-CTERM domain-containing protein